MKNNIITGTILILSLTSAAQNELDNYLITAAGNNPGLQAKFNEYMAALEKLPQAGSLPDPKLAFGYFIQPVETRVGPQQARISVSQMFPWFGTLGAGKDVATEMAKAKFELFEDAKSRLYYDVKSTWYNLYFTQRAIDITRENIDILNTFQKLALVKIEAGKGSAVDELRVEMEILDMENQLYLLLDKLNSQKIAFNNLLNVDESREVVIPDLLMTDQLNPDRRALLDSIRMNNHQILSLEFQQASYEYQQIVARKMGKPEFTVGFDYIFIGKSSNGMTPPDESGRDAVILPMVGISIPLYRKKYTSMIKEAVYMQEAAHNKKIDKMNILESAYEQANTDYQDSKRRLDLHNKQLELAQKALRILESEYATNVKNFEEILRMERQVLMHSLELEKSRSDLNASIAFINYLMGN
ncbi:MAG: TolC family protein [Bacteroidales bacterium]|nr:TolC family protein [Bacteroidales bacterium]